VGGWVRGSGGTAGSTHTARKFSGEGLLVGHWLTWPAVDAAWGALLWLPGHGRKPQQSQPGSSGSGKVTGGLCVCVYWGGGHFGVVGR
jgi:hypothetical protein